MKKTGIRGRGMKRTLAVTMAAVLAFSSVGCGKTTGKEESRQEQTSAVSETYSGEPVEATYPLTTEKKKLTIYAKNSLGSSTISSYNEIEAFKRAAEKLGVEIEWSHPVEGSETDQYNLMIASQELPDIIFWDFSTTSTKLTGLIENGSAIDMDSLIRQYAPNYLKALEQDETLMKQAISDEGKYCAMYKLEPTPARLVTSGPVVRKDLLDQYQLDVPVTMDDWFETLSTFKDHGIAAPLTVWASNKLTYLYFTMSAFKTYYSFYKDPATQTVTYGPITENYKEWLKEMNRWYEAGLIDPEFTSTDRKTLTSNMTGGKSAATATMLSGGIGNMTKSGRETNPDFELVGCRWPVQKEEDTSYMINFEAQVRVGGMGAVVTSSCEDPILAVQVLDYFYGEEGDTLINWGIEGETFTVDSNGKKQFTDLILNNPEGKIPAQEISHYALPSHGFTKAMDYDAWSQINLSLPEQVEANRVWAEGDSSMMLPNLELTGEKNDEYNKIMNEINTYVDENQIRFITGSSDIDAEFDSYVEQIKKMKIETATEYMQEAYTSYMNR